MTCMACAVYSCCYVVFNFAESVADDESLLLHWPTALAFILLSGVAHLI